MVTRPALRNALLGRDVAVAFATLGALYLVRFVEVQALQIPAYLLIVAYDTIEMVFPIVTPFHVIGFPLFLYLLAVVGAGAARAFQPDDETDGVWVRAIGGVFVLIGIISLLFGAFVGGPLVAPADNPTPLAITGATGVVLLLAAWVLLRRG